MRHASGAASAAKDHPDIGFHADTFDAECMLPQMLSFESCPHVRDSHLAALAPLRNILTALILNRCSQSTSPAPDERGRAKKTGKGCHRFTVLIALLEHVPHSWMDLIHFERDLRSKNASFAFDSVPAKR